MYEMDSQWEFAVLYVRGLKPVILLALNTAWALQKLEGNTESKNML